MPDFEQALARARPDVLHAGPVPTCGFMAALSGFRPLVLMSWGSDLLVEADRSPAWHWAATCALRHADIFQCDCDAVRTKALNLHALRSDQIVQFPWGIDLSAFPPGGATAGIREKLGWQAAVVVISNRSWEPIYGIGTVLESFRVAALADDRLRLLLLGHGSEVDMVHAYIRQHHLEAKVCLGGRVGNDQLAPYLREADLYMSCSHSDGASISLLEAMAIGLPCIVSDIPGNREWIVPGEGGWLAPVGDAAACARALDLAAALAPSERRRIGETNRAVAAARADWSRNLQLLMDAYERLVQG
jgi:glycosyltransferase involved in cell wall biosynthesis